MERGHVVLRMHVQSELILRRRRARRRRLGASSTGVLRVMRQRVRVVARARRLAAGQRAPASGVVLAV